MYQGAITDLAQTLSSLSSRDGENATLESQGVAGGHS